MEACIMVCRAKKPKDRKNKILFINAIKEVTRKNAESYLEDSHIEKIAEAYKSFKNIDNFSVVVTKEEIENNDYLLSIPLYLQKTILKDEEILSINESYENWLSKIELKNISFEKLNGLIEDNDTDD
jgi:type I restriction enzyme M protein